MVWVDVDGKGVSFNTAYGRAKPTYIANDGRVSLTVIDPQDPYRWISVSGTATLVDEGADDHIDRLAKKYIGADTYPFRQPGERRVTVRIAVETSTAAGWNSYATRTECTGGRFVAAVNHVAPASFEPNTSPEVAPK